MAPIAPTIKDKIAQTIKSGCRLFQTPKKVPAIKLERVNSILIFGTIAKKAVTIVGLPSYTSGSHIWNGAAANLNNKAIDINRLAIITSLSFAYHIRKFKASKLVSPV